MDLKLVSLILLFALVAGVQGLDGEKERILFDLASAVLLNEPGTEADSEVKFATYFNF